MSTMNPRIFFLDIDGATLPGDISQVTSDEAIRLILERHGLDQHGEQFSRTYRLFLAPGI